MNGDADQRSYRRFATTVLVLVGIGFAAVLAAGVAAFLVMVRTQDQNWWVNHTHEVDRTIATLRLDVERMRSARRGVLAGFGEVERAKFDDAARDVDAQITKVARLTVDNRLQQERIPSLRFMAASVESMLRSSLAPGANRSAVAESARQTETSRLEALAVRMAADEARLLSLREEAQRDSVRLFYWALAGMGLLLIGVAIGSTLAILRFARELGEARDVLRGLNENLEGAVRERTQDLQRANEEIQRFAYIVSHDLRSPLVNVMGFTAELDAATKSIAALIDSVEQRAPELATEDARAAAREDLPEAIGFIRTSTQKMDRLINAILRLSREGRRVVTPEPIDTDALAQGVVDSLAHRTDELGAEVQVAGSLPALVSDRLGIEQILSNLVENALKYLKPGRPGWVGVTGRREGQRVLIEVADNGRGVDPRDHERIFDLFRRSGVQDQPGEGIGLAHVRALAYRLGGTISVDSRLDEGATFTINLPAELAGEQRNAA